MVLLFFSLVVVMMVMVLLLALATFWALATKTGSPFLKKSTADRVGS